jgi:ABC-type glycerol-3-phosphate transport system permease component
MQTQTPPPDSFVVTVIREPAKEVTFGDVILSALGVTGVLVILSLVLAALMAFVLVRWRRRHPPESDHLPSVSPLIPGQTPPPSSPAP